MGKKKKKKTMILVSTNQTTQAHALAEVEEEEVYL
jgi:hypothetical protein